MRTAMCAIAAMASMALASCGGGAAAPPPEPSTLASRIHGCHGYTRTEVSMYAHEEGQCDLANGDLADIATFGTGDARDYWMTFAKAFGGVYVVGDLWVVSVETQAEAQAVQHDLGGDAQ